ncbi:MAG: hypothetical protein ACJAY3_000591 [Neolewinella sp.]|jgi:hypothetical protein
MKNTDDTGTRTEVLKVDSQMFADKHLEIILQQSLIRTLIRLAIDFTDETGNGFDIELSY